MEILLPLPKCYNYLITFILNRNNYRISLLPERLNREPGSVLFAVVSEVVSLPPFSRQQNEHPPCFQFTKLTLLRRFKAI